MTFIKIVAFAKLIEDVWCPQFVIGLGCGMVLSGIAMVITGAFFPR